MSHDNNENQQTTSNKKNDQEIGDFRFAEERHKQAKRNFSEVRSSKDFTSQECFARGYKRETAEALKRGKESYIKFFEWHLKEIPFCFSNISYPPFKLKSFSREKSIFERQTKNTKKNFKFV